MVRILPKPITFEWDKGNQEKNFLKHKVTIKEIEEAFESEDKFLFIDSKHSQKEDRMMLWGITNDERKLSIIFTQRKEKIRVISARDMNKKERRAYEEKIKNNTEI